MPNIYRTHPKSSWAATVVLALLLILIVFSSLFDWNVFRPRLAKMFTDSTGRQTTIDGDLKVHLFSWNPRAEINGVAIANPPWADRKTMFAADRITVSVSLLRLLRGQIVLPLIELRGPTINLERDHTGRASWELGTKEGKPTHDTKPTKLPTIRRLVIADGKLHVVDEIRKLSFGGSLVAGEEAGKDDASALQIHSTGTLNAKPFTLQVNGGPLLDLEPDKPYTFSTDLTASDIKLHTQVTVEKPFNMSDLSVKFTVSGNDLADAYYLTGLALPNTPKYRLSATVRVDGTTLTIDDLNGRLGSSDLSGKVQVQTGGARPKLTATLSSTTLNIADLAPTLGEQAAGAQKTSLAADKSAGKGAKKAPKAAAAAAAPGPAEGLLLPDSDLQVNRVRGMDADVSYRAASVKAPKVPMRQVVLRVVLDNGLLTLDPVSFDLDAGRVAGRVQIDARKDVPTSDIDLHIDGIDLAQFKSTALKQPPLEGTLLGRFKIHGSGSSVHKLAAGSDGAISVVIPHGQINQAMAELTGINVLSGLGLLLSKEQANAEVRCAIIDFKDTGGRLNTTTVYVDTTTVLITGRGNINLASEDLDMSLQGDPKKIRFLRLRSPISLGGTMLHPTVGVKAGKLAAQVGVATALGVFLTPAAAALAFIDPGLGKTKDCSTVLAQANAGVQNETNIGADVAPNPPPRTR